MPRPSQRTTSQARQSKSRKERRVGPSVPPETNEIRQSIQVIGLHHATLWSVSKLSRRVLRDLPGELSKHPGFGRAMSVVLSVPKSPPLVSKSAAPVCEALAQLINPINSGQATLDFSQKTP